MNTASRPSQLGRALVDGERGSVTVVGVAAVAAVLAMLAIAMQLGAAVITRHRAEAAADLAALAVAAGAVDGTKAACASGQRVTDAMTVRLVSCELHGWEASVQVEAVAPGVLARFGSARASARAGPAATASAATEAEPRRAVDSQR